MQIVGELINASRKRIAKAIREQDAATVQQIAQEQASAGADFIDVNAGTFEEREAECLQWLVRRVQEVVEVPCSIDSPDPAALKAGLDAHEGAALVNSISLEQGRLEGVTPLLADSDHSVIALCMTDEGMPETLDDRLSAAERLVNHLVANHVKPQHIFVDPLLQPVSTSGDAPMTALSAVEAIRARFPEVHAICGLSNVSYGLPKRKILNQTFVAMAIARGLDAAILNPLDERLRTSIVAAEALAGRDPWCERYLDAYREQQLAG